MESKQQQALKTKVSSEATPPGTTRKVEAIPKEQIDLFAPKIGKKHKKKLNWKTLKAHTKVSAALPQAVNV
jgi:hypothetical protein